MAFDIPLRRPTQSKQEWREGDRGIDDLRLQALGEREDDAVGSAEIAEAVDVLVLRDLVQNFGAVLSQSFERIMADA